MFTVQRVHCVAETECVDVCNATGGNLKLYYYHNTDLVEDENKKTAVIAPGGTFTVMKTEGIIITAVKDCSQKKKHPFVTTEHNGTKHNGIQIQDQELVTIIKV